MDCNDKNKRFLVYNTVWDKKCKKESNVNAECCVIVDDDNCENLYSKFEECIKKDITDDIVEIVRKIRGILNGNEEIKLKVQIRKGDYIQDVEYFDSNYNIAIFKEHFLLNDFLDWKDRTNYYDFLNSNEGYLLIHCADKIRVEYIQKLISNFPNMNIIIAHLGRDTYEKPEFIMQVINNFKDNEKVMFDLSTIHNIDNLLYAIDNVGTGRILYGSDFPFEFKNLCEIKEFKQKILNSIGYEENIFEKNFENIKKKIYVKK